MSFELWCIPSFSLIKSICNMHYTNPSVGTYNIDCLDQCLVGVKGFFSLGDFYYLFTTTEHRHSLWICCFGNTRNLSSGRKNLFFISFIQNFILTFNWKIKHILNVILNATLNAYRPSRYSDNSFYFCYILLDIIFDLNRSYIYIYRISE